MTHSKTKIANAIQAISIPGYTGKLPRFQGKQPLFAAARFHSKKNICWGYAMFNIHSIEKIWQPKLEKHKDIGYDYDPDFWTAYIPEDLEQEYHRQFKWGLSCGYYQDDEDPVCIARSELTVADKEGNPIDNFWEICVINRDQKEFWTCLMSGDPQCLGVEWMQSFVDPLAEVLNWAIKNPDIAETWLLAEPTPQTLIGPDPDLDKLISKIKLAIRRGGID